METKYKKKHSLKEIYKTHWDDYLKSKERKLWIEKRHFEAVYKTLSCRTSRLGVTSYICNGCGHRHFIHRSCGHRFCGTCGVVETYKWTKGSLQRLLNIKHHHIVMTLPKSLRLISKLNDNKLHDLLFNSSVHVLKEWFRIKHNLLPGIVSVLHTAGADLKYHPHVHMIVSGGGKQLDSEVIRELKSDYLTRQRFLGKQLRDRFIFGLLKLEKKGDLSFPHNWKLKDNTFKTWLHRIRDKHWIVSIQKPLVDINHIVAYVGRYTKRACISEYKLESHTKNEISFQYTDYKNSIRGQKPLVSIKRMSPHDFLDQLLQHVPKKRYRMVRYFGLYCSHYIGKIDRIKNKKEDPLEDQTNIWGEFEEMRKEDIRRGKPDPLICPHCGTHLEFEDVFYPYKINIDDS